MIAQVATLARVGPETDKQARQRARKRANQRIAFLGHAVVFVFTTGFLFLVAGFFAGLVVAASWGIGLAAHGFFGVVAPVLRERWVEQEVQSQVQSRVQTTVVRERRNLGEEHARKMHQLSASVAHEIRNPITAAKSLVQQMGEDPNSAQNVEYAKVAIEELDRVERSISHLLRYAREESLNLAEMSFNPVIASALETVDARLEGVSVEQQLTPDDRLVADGEALRRVVINLVNNALDAIEERQPAEPRLSIASGHNLSGDTLWLSVRDNGSGIDPAQRTDVFSPFHTSKSHGTGLGLAITKKLVEAHGGTIEVNPQITDGTEIMITLPRAADTVGA